MRTATKRLAGGRIAYYAYAWQGGPLVAKAEGESTDAARRALETLLATPEMMAKLASAQGARAVIDRPAPSVAYIAGLVPAFLNSPEFARLKPITQRDYRRYLDLFRTDFGDWRVSLFEDPRIAQDMADWRDAAGGARTGDLRMSVVSRLFSWARGRGMTTARPTEAIERIHSADRSEMIWQPADLSALLAVSPEPLQWAVRLAVLTGLRQGDLIRLPWSAASDVAIRWRTSKRGRNTVIPITTELRELLATIPRRSPVMLTSATGQPWTGDGLRTAFQRSRARAGIEGLRWHDLRGTAVTHLAKTDLRQRDIARIIGWSEARVEAIMARYVSADALALEMLARMSGEHDPQTACKPEI